jgi:hypothetical protein
VGPTCHSDDGKFGDVPNAFPDLRSTVELLHGGTPWICSSGAIFAELELSQTRLSLNDHISTFFFEVMFLTKTIVVVSTFASNLLLPWKINCRKIIIDTK